MNSTECVIEANPDVSGVGIRISAYSLCLGGRIVAFLINMVSPTHNANNFNRTLRTTMSIQGLALLSTALYQTAHNQLTLFHAVVVLHLLALLGITLTTSAAVSKKNETAHLIVNGAVYVIAVAAFVTFNVLVWSRAPTFGSQPECNSTVVYVLFGVSIQATNDIFRYIILATFAAVPGFFVLFLILSAPCWIGAWCCSRRGSRSNPSRERHITREWSSLDSSDDESRAMWIQESINIAAYTGMAIYAIVSLEQMVARNRVSDEEREWTFGQVLSLFLLFGVGNEVLNVVISSVNGKPAMDEGGEDSGSIEMRHWS